MTERKRRRALLAQILLYGAAALALLVFLYKNTSAYEFHLLDVRNSTGKSPAVGAKMPEFIVEEENGELVGNGEFPESYCLILSTPGCPYTEAMLEELAKEGDYRGVRDIRMVYLAVTGPEEREQIHRLAERYGGIPFYLDAENTVKWSMKISDSPTLLMVEGGKISYKAVGYHPGQYTALGE